MVRTDNYFLFETADKLGKTVREFVVGEPGPLSCMELYMWVRFRIAEARLVYQYRRRRG